MLASTIEAIDAANAEDPNDFAGEPLALVQGRSASIWLERLAPDAGDELRLAARAHHLRRWEILRADYPAGRQGYLQWRRDNKGHQADSLAKIMADDGWGDESIERVRSILGRTRLRTDPETQTLEDVACLVFLETQYGDMAARTEHDHMVSIVAKTLKKMSEPAITLAGSIDLSNSSQAVLADAVALLGAEEPDDE